MFKTRRDLRARFAASPEKRPRPVQPVRDCVLRAQWGIALPTVDTRTDVATVGRDRVIDKTLHEQMIPLSPGRGLEVGRSVRIVGDLDIGL
jgi:hypothetical protein